MDDVVYMECAMHISSIIYYFFIVLVLPFLTMNWGEKIEKLSVKIVWCHIISLESW